MGSGRRVTGVRISLDAEKLHGGLIGVQVRRAIDGPIEKEAILALPPVDAMEEPR